jgi:hypothetical protein
MNFKDYLNNYLNEGMVSLMGSGKDIEIDNSKKPMSLSNSIKNKYSNLIKEPHYKSMGELSKNIISALKKLGLEASVGNEIWLGGFYGTPSTEKTETLFVDLSKDGIPYKNKLKLLIYKLPSGNYELNSYIT